MRILIFSLISLLFLGNTALAADSRANRAERIGYIGISPIGIHIPTLLTNPAQVGFFLGDSLMIGVEKGEAAYESTDSDTNSTVTATYKNQGAWVRYFAGNSFNFLFAYNTRVFQVDASVTETTTYSYSDGSSESVTATAEGSVTAEANVLTAGIGNQWNLGGFVLGVDWLVGSSLSSASNSYTIDTNTGIDTTQAEEDFDQIGKDLNDISALPGVLILTLGFSF
ncbi:MAG: hypothetical protein QNL04_03445 [SAR324 cluster bacterium]|nr:hypothetical protein [SAR324 cluster bacterium]